MQQMRTNDLTVERTAKIVAPPSKTCTGTATWAPLT